ncbi:NADP-dependent mannitol dehydrogenase 2 [Phlyctema vagabunda]|uniref:NADP-dependent mannitol dehydrogenase 2 n=1 Tax=Phlyctema vagabunda TaxID=108571 RepID=A0ABR4P5E4_9HELO
MAPTVDRDALSNRILPQITLSNGSATSLTAPPPSATPESATASERAQQRFAVTGNAIITGGAGTLGFAAARALLEHGLAGLDIYDVNPASAQGAIDALAAEFPGARIRTTKIDITDEAALEHAVAATALELGSVDSLLCFAGVVDCTHAIDMTAAQWRRTLDINTTGSFLCAQAVARQMIAQGTRGSIVFTASISGHRVNFPQPQVSYNVSKSAVLTLKNCLAAEWARYGIRVNSISPGYMDTILNEGEGLSSTRQVWNERNPMGRMGTPSELTGVVVFLTSTASSYVNGADIVCDGGQVLF